MKKHVKGKTGTYSTRAAHVQRYGTYSHYTLALASWYILGLMARKTQENSRLGHNKNTKHVKISVFSKFVPKFYKLSLKFCHTYSKIYPKLLQDFL